MLSSSDVNRPQGVLDTAATEGGARRRDDGRLTGGVSRQVACSVASDPSFGRSRLDVLSSISSTDDDDDDNDDDDDDGSATES